MRLRSVTALGGVLATACAGIEARPDTTADVATIRSMLDEAVAAHHAGDAARWAGLFTNDGMLLPEGAPTVSGMDSLLRWAQDFFTTYTSTARIEAAEIEVAGDWAYARNVIWGTLTPKQGGSGMPLDAKEIVIFRRQPDGSWKVARVIYNSNRPPGGL